MDSSKYSIPKLPLAQHILDDLSDPNVIKNNHPMKMTDGDVLQDANNCYMYLKGLQEDLAEHNKLNTKLADLNKKLVENIENIKLH